MTNYMTFSAHNYVECRWPVVVWSKLLAVYDYGTYNIKVMLKDSLTHAHP